MYDHIDVLNLRADEIYRGVLFTLRPITSAKEFLRHLHKGYQTKYLDSFNNISDEDRDELIIFLTDALPEEQTMKGYSDTTKKIGEIENHPKFGAYFKKFKKYFDQLDREQQFGLMRACFQKISLMIDSLRNGISQEIFEIDDYENLLLIDQALAIAKQLSERINNLIDRRKKIPAQEMMFLLNIFLQIEGIRLNRLKPESLYDVIAFLTTIFSEELKKVQEIDSDLYTIVGETL